ncbi:MAG: hypothetical protein WKF89_16805 [Chitinophagaceae bacterium]
MEMQTKTPVAVLQEIIALLSTRKEICEKLKQNKAAGELAGKLDAVVIQSDEFIAELLNELSEFGDAVQGDVERENEYQHKWKSMMSDIDTMSSDVLSNSFQSLEALLSSFYHTTIETNTDLPESLLVVLTRQLEVLKKGS